MKWFYNLKNKIRIGIAVASWLPLIIMFAATGGDADKLGGGLLALAAVFLALGIVFTVFAVRAAMLDKQTRNNDKVIVSNETPDADIDTRLIEIEDLLAQTNTNIANTPDADKRAKKSLLESQLALINEKKTLLQRKMSIMENADPTIIERAAAEQSIAADFGVSVKLHRGVELPIFTKVVGVTFDNRQLHIQKSVAGDELSIKHKPTEDYPNTIAIKNDRTGKTLGNIKSELADALLDEFGNGLFLFGSVVEITGGADSENGNFGCNISIDGEAD